MTFTNSNLGRDWCRSFYIFVIQETQSLHMLLVWWLDGWSVCYRKRWMDFVCVCVCVGMVCVDTKYWNMTNFKDEDDNIQNVLMDMFILPVRLCVKCVTVKFQMNFNFERDLISSYNFLCVSDMYFGIINFKLYFLLLLYRYKCK